MACSVAGNMRNGTADLPKSPTPPERETGPAPKTRQHSPRCLKPWKLWAIMTGSALACLGIWEPLTLTIALVTTANFPKWPWILWTPCKPTPNNLPAVTDCGFCSRFPPTLSMTSPGITSISGKSALKST